MWNQQDGTLGRRIREAMYLFLGLALCGVIIISPATAAVLDYFGPPPAGDPSAQTGPYVGMIYADNLLKTLPPANEGAIILQGGVQGTDNSVGVNNAVPAPGQSNGAFNIPTNSQPSPMYGAQPFTQQMLLFEEFGPEPLDFNAALPPNPFPQPTDNQSGPAGTALEAFLAQSGIGPIPTRLSNNVDLNPWKSAIESFINRPLAAPPAEGRPPGEAWAHQRWNEFKPQAFFKTAQAGARTNGGFRDAKQRHGYSVGEFGLGGLYHTVYGTNDNAAILVGTTNGLAIRFHPNMPVQDPKALWTFDGTLPPKLLMARYGQPVLMRHYNALPIDPTANRGFGLHTITTHEHNGHSPSESDGYANAFFFPGEFYDYRWPLQLAGYDTINTSATDPRAAFPCSPGETLFVNDSTDNTVTPKSCPPSGSIMIRGDWHETMSTHWFHDHMLDFTAQNVYKGNAVMMNYYSALDRGNEGFIDNVNLRFPSGTALPWGNRDYDVNLVLGDKAWDQTGQLWFNIFNTDGFLGDHLFVNWLYSPYMEVRARRYRFRVLNGSVSRFYATALVRQRNDTLGEMPGPGGSGVSYDRIPIHMIANDGNILEHAVPFDGTMDLYGTGNLRDSKGATPTHAIAERYDYIVDFSKYGIQPGDKLYWVNVLEHKNGQVVSKKVPLADILSEAYKPVVSVNNGVSQWINGDPVVGKFLEFRVQPYSGTDLSMNPDDYIPGKLTMIPLLVHHDNCDDLAALQNMRHRTFDFGRGGTDASPWTIKTDDGLLGIVQPGFNMDPRRISAAPQLATGPTQAGYNAEVAREVWAISGGQGWDHPVHVHFEEGVYLSRGGPPEDPAACLQHRQSGTPPPNAPPEWEKWARKDMYRIGPDADSRSPIYMAIRFREFAGTYVEHCHNTQHEDHAMLLRWDVEHPGQFLTMATPLPSWDGVEYVDSAALPTVRTVELFGNPADNTTPGNSVTYTASLIGVPGTGPFEYQFQRRSHDGGGWTTAQAWGASDNLVWSTNGYAPGAYDMKVSVRTVGSSSELGESVIPFTLTSSAATGVTLTPSPDGMAPAGTSVVFTAAASGGSSSYQYRFWLLTGSTWTMVQDYSSSPTWTWNTASVVPGYYLVAVHSRTVGSTASSEAGTTYNYLINSAVPPATTVTLTPSPDGMAPAGTSVVFTAAASGGSGSYQYRFWLLTGSTWTMVQDYSSSAIWTWNTTGVVPGYYLVAVHSRTVGSTASSEAGNTYNYLVQ